MQQSTFKVITIEWTIDYLEPINSVSVFGNYLLTHDQLMQAHISCLLT